MRNARLVAVGAVVLLGCGGGRDRPMDGPDAGAPPGSFVCEGCTSAPIGMPAWEPVDLTILVTPLGDPADITGYLANLDRIFGPSHDAEASNPILLPGPAHEGPYRGELARLAAGSGYERSQTIAAWDYAVPGGIVLALMLVPTDAAPMGSSPDFAMGPIIPNASFPIHLDGELTRDGAPYDSMFDSDYPALSMFDPPVELMGDGLSHIPLVWGESDAFGPPMTPREGSYLYTVTMTDATGAGWTVTMPFTITPAPNPGCDDMGEHRNFDEALLLESGTLEGKVCDFGDMYVIGGMGERTLTLRSDPSMGNLEMAVFAGSPDHTMLRRTMDIQSREEITANAGDFVQVFGEAPAMMGPYLIGIQ